MTSGSSLKDRSRRLCPKCIALVAMLLSFAESSRAADRFDAVGQLIQHSSASTQVATSGEEAAIAKQREAKELYDRAVAARDSGTPDEAKVLLDQASRVMFEAVRLAKPQAVVEDKKRADFTRRRESLEKLAQAYERVRSEKQSDAGKREIDGPAKQHLAEADALFAAGKLDEARAELDDAYAAVKTAVGEVHGGDTVVRSLHFETKADEYKYELDRNETHRLLIENLLAQKTDQPALRGQVQPFLDRAAAGRAAAEAAAAKGDHAQATETLEEATKELIRALRAAGVFLPG